MTPKDTRTRAWAPTPFNKGWAAFEESQRGLGLTDILKLCPFMAGTAEAIQWFNGYTLNEESSLYGG